MFFQFFVNSLQVYSVIYFLYLSRFLLLSDQITQLFFMIFDISFVLLIHCSQFVAFLNKFCILSQDPIYVLFSHLFIVDSNVLHHFQLLLHPSCLSFQLIIDIFSSILLLMTLSLVVDLAAFFF